MDILRDEAEEFAEKLKAADVHVKCQRYKGHFHNSMVDVHLFGEVAEDVYREMKSFIAAVTP